MSEIPDDDLPEIRVEAYDKIDHWRDKLDQTAKLKKRDVFEHAAADLFLEAECERDLGAVQAIADAIYVLGRDYAGLCDDDIQYVMVGAKAKVNDGSDGKERDEAFAETSEKRKDRFELEALDEIVIGDDPVELIPSILPMGPALGVSYGPPKSLKSFLLIHAGLHVASNIPYCGRDLQAGAVVYVTSEGVNGARRRLIAQRRALGLEGKRVPFFLVATMPNLGAGPRDREVLQQKIADKLAGLGIPLRMIVIDTMRRAMPGKSENKPEDISVVVDNCEALAREFNCLVALIHHSPRSDDDRSSGSNALDAAADALIGCKRDPATKIATVTVHHLKDGEEGDTWQFELRPIEIGIDRDGQPINSCYVQITQEPERKTTPAKPKELTAEQQRVYDILVNAVAEAGVAGLAGSAAPANTRAVTRDILSEYLKKQGWWDTANDDSSRAKMSRRLNEIAGKHRIGLTDRCVWPALAR
jgi:hypothetical protein